MAPMENLRKMSFPRTQWRVAGSRIEPWVSNLSITTPMLYWLRYCCRFVMPVLSITRLHSRVDTRVSSSGGSRKFWWEGMIKIFNTKPQKFESVVTKRVARNSQWSSCFKGLGAEPPALKNFAFFCKNNLILELVW